MKKIKAVFFDLDDTLFPAEAVYQRGLSASWRLFHKRSGISWKSFRRLYARARTDVKRTLGASPSARSRLLYFKRMAEIHLNRSDPKFTLALMRAYNSCFQGLEKIRGGWLSVLARRYILGIITNQVCDMQLLKLSRLDPMGRCFNVVVTSEEMGIEKPSKKIFLEACRRAHCKPRQALMVGNSWKTDVRPAMEAGLSAALLDPRSSTKQITPRLFQIQKLSDLPRVLNEKSR